MSTMGSTTGGTIETAIGLLHPGEMGAAVGATLTGAGRRVLWASAGRSPATADRADAAGLTDAGSLDALCAASDVVLSIVPPHAALPLAREIAATGFSGVYVDANAVSPATAEDVAKAVQEAGAAYVDGGIVGGPPGGKGSTRIYLSGERADQVAALCAGTALDAEVLGDDPTAASAMKMVFAAWTKGSAALLLALRETARSYGVDEALVAQWSDSLPELPARSEQARASAAAKGWRWTGEMTEIAATFAAAGQPDGFHRAAAAVFAAYPRPETG
jgi:3-hydroxyisobutyrate dehydrogenase-like beta-hydroxyacid dehydrogenase